MPESPRFKKNDQVIYEKQKIRKNVTIVDVHRDDPPHFYYTIRENNSSDTETIQTVEEYLRSAPSEVENYFTDELALLRKSILEDTRKYNEALNKAQLRLDELSDLRAMSFVSKKIDDIGNRDIREQVKAVDKTLDSLINTNKKHIRSEELLYS